MSEEIKGVCAVGDFVRFKGYPPGSLDDGEDPILREGEVVQITKIGMNGNDVAYTAWPLKDDGVTQDKDRKGEQLFEEEFDVVDVSPEAPEAVTDLGGSEPDVPVEAPEKAKAEPKAGSKAKGKGKGSKKAESKKAEQAVETPTESVQQVESPAPTEPVPPADPAPEVVVDPDASTQPDEVAPQEEAYNADVPTDSPSIDLERGAFEHDPLVLEIIQHTNDLAEACHALSAQHEEIYFKLGGVLSEAKRNELHVTAGFEDSADGFNKWASEHCGVGERKAYHLQRIYRTFRMAGIGSENLREIGWTKCRVLAKVPVDVLARDRDELLDTARTQTRDELESHVKTTYENADQSADRIQKNTYKFQIYGSAIALVEQAIDLAKEGVDGADANTAFERIATEWLQFQQAGGAVVQEGSMIPMPQNGEELQQVAQAMGLGITVEGPLEEFVQAAEEVVETNQS